MDYYVISVILVSWVRKLKKMIFAMVANPDFRSGFETDLNPDLTKLTKFGSGLKSGFQIMIRIKSGFRISNLDSNRISNFKSGFRNSNPD
jgi:hypothetical protein